MTNEYISFFGKNSWWEYGIQGHDDLQRWTAVSSISGVTNETFNDGTKHNLFAASLAILPDIGYYECNYSAVSSVDSDKVSIGGKFSYTIFCTNTTIVGNGSFPLENSVEVGGHTYNNVLHLLNNESYFKEVWIAPKVGIIKMIRSDNKVFYLKRFQIEKL